MKTIVKIQTPLLTTDPEPKCLVYNEDRSIQMQIPYDEATDSWMEGRLKAFFLVDINEKHELFIHKEVKNHDW